jgi:hypothetical protein
VFVVETTYPVIPRLCRYGDERADILAIVNAAGAADRDVIPPDASVSPI